MTKKKRTIKCRYATPAELDEAVRAVWPRGQSKRMPPGQRKKIAAGCKRFLSYHALVVKATLRRASGKAVSMKEQLAIIDSGKDINRELIGSLRSTLETLVADKRLDKIQAAMDPALELDFAASANPALFDDAQMQPLKELGISRQQAVAIYEQLALPNRELISGIIQRGELRMGIKALLKDFDSIRFETPATLVGDGLLTLEGNNPNQTEGLTGAAVMVYGGYLYDKGKEDDNVLLQVIGVATIILGAVTIIGAAAKEVGKYLGWFSFKTGPSLVNEPAPVVEKGYGYVVGNMHRNKMEVHVPNCRYLPRLKAENQRRFATLDEGRAAGLDNCHYCVGGSTR